MVPHGLGYFSFQQLLCRKVSIKETVWVNLIGVLFYLKDAIVVRDYEIEQAGLYLNAGVGLEGERKEA